MIKTVSVLISVATLLIAGLIAFTAPGVKLGLWQYTTAFSIMLKGAPFLMGGMALTLVALIISLVTKKSGVVVPAIVALGLGGAVMVGLMNLRSTASQHPIHDITTDFRNPPPIITAANVERSNPARYVGNDPVSENDLRTVERAQRDIYPDLLPLYLQTDVQSAYAAAKAVSIEMGWEIINEEANIAFIEATYTSFWFGFVDDIIIRITRDDADGVLLNMRSKSRVGRSDLGANAARIKAFQAKMREKIEG